tara:strand:- start:3702 stop:4772 length:1071 start_codon:yes stop_codon:yes gene_type:complete
MTTFQLNKFCSPAQVYLILAGLGLVFMIFNDFRLGTLILHFIFVILFAYILDYLCSIKLTAISWILVFLPWLFLFSTFFLALDVGQEQGNIIEAFPNIGSAFSWCDNNKNHKNYKQICSDAGGGTTGKAKSSKDKAAAYVDWCDKNKTHEDYDSLCNNVQFKRIKQCYSNPLDPQCGKIEVVTNNVAKRIEEGDKGWPRYKGRISKLKKTYIYSNGLQHYRNVKSIHDLLDKESTKLDKEAAKNYLRKLVEGFRESINRWKVCSTTYCSGSSDQNDPAVQNTINVQAARSLAIQVLNKYYGGTGALAGIKYTTVGGLGKVGEELNRYSNANLTGGSNSPFVKEWDKNIKSAMAKRT